MKGERIKTWILFYIFYVKVYLAEDKFSCAVIVGIKIATFKNNSSKMQGQGKNVCVYILLCSLDWPQTHEPPICISTVLCHHAQNYFLL